MVAAQPEEREEAHRLDHRAAEEAEVGHLRPRYDLFPIEWELRGEGSLGKIWRKGATTPDNAGNKVSINIKAVRGKAHPGDPDANVPNNFVIYTAYPK